MIIKNPDGKYTLSHKQLLINIIVLTLHNSVVYGTLTFNSKSFSPQYPGELTFSCRKVLLGRIFINYPKDNTVNIHDTGGAAPLSLSR